MRPTDKQILTWLQRHPFAVCCHRPGKGRRYWRIVFGPKDQTNIFPSLRAVVAAAMKL